MARVEPRLVDDEEHRERHQAQDERHLPEAHGLTRLAHRHRPRAESDDEDAGQQLTAQLPRVEGQLVDAPVPGEMRA